VGVTLAPLEAIAPSNPRILIRVVDEFRQWRSASFTLPTFISICRSAHPGIS
jgi:hypothetical protein